MRLKSQNKIFRIYRIAVDHFMSRRKSNSNSTRQEKRLTQDHNILIARNIIRLTFWKCFFFFRKSKHRECLSCGNNNIDIKLVLSSFKISNLFSVKDPIPRGLHTGVAYKVLCASCSACYVSETTRHFSTRVQEHIFSDRTSHIFKHFQNSEHCPLYALMTVLAS